MEEWGVAEKSGVEEMVVEEMVAEKSEVEESEVEAMVAVKSEVDETVAVEWEVAEWEV